MSGARRAARRATALAGAAAALALGACAPHAPLAEHAPRPEVVATPADAPARPFVREELFFGVQRRSGPPVSDAEWAAFLAEVVTPRFPEGLTVLAGRGQYRLADGSIVEEGTRVIVLLYPTAPASQATREAAIAEITREYKRRFDQESVLRVSTGVRASVR